jgi:hypothetical protein
MNRKQKNSEMMGMSTEQVLTDHATEYQGNPIVETNAQKHKDNMAEIALYEQKQLEGMDIIGLVRDKNLLKSLMGDDRMKIVKAIKALAAESDNNQLASSVNFTKSQLVHEADAAALADFNKINSVAVSNAAALLPHGISAQFLTNYASDILAFDSIIKKPKTLRASVKGYTQKLGEAVNKMLTHLSNKLDLNMDQYAGTQLHTDYFNARATYDYGNNATGLRGLISDPNGHPLNKVLVEIVDYPEAGEVMLKSTGSNGKYIFKKINAEKCTIRVRKNKYTTAEFEVFLEKDNFKEFNIVMMAEPVTQPNPVNV